MLESRATIIGLLGLVGLMAAPLSAQDRDTKVRNDRRAFQASKDWVYNDLEEGIKLARKTDKPMLVVFRCIPCEACQEFDDDVARRDPIIRDLMDQFVCVRIVQANAMDLTHFQFDFDQSFAAILMNADMTIYGRYGTRSARDEDDDMSLHGLRKAMEGALVLHKDLDTFKASLKGKQVTSSRYKTPLEFPSVPKQVKAELDYEGKVAQSCLHCHQVREAERKVYRDAGEFIPDTVLFTYPDPSSLGLTMDPKEMATVAKIAADSIASRAGIAPGDKILSLEDQPLLSIADIQWILHNAPSSGRLSARLNRGGVLHEAEFELPEGWRRGNLSWRPTSWDLRRMGLGGMRLDELTDDERTKIGIPSNAMALKIRHLGEYGEHAVALRAGIRKGDVIVAFDGLTDRLSESDLLAHSVQKRRRGETVEVGVLRNGERKTFRIAMQ